MLVPPGQGGSPPLPPPPPPSPPPAFAVPGQPLLFTPPDPGQGSIQGVIITNMSPYPIEVYNGEQIDKWLPPGVMDYVPLGYNASQIKVIPYSLTTRSIATIEAQSLLLAWVQAGDPLPDNLPIVVQQTTTTVPVAAVTILNSGFSDTQLGAGLTMVAAPGLANQLVLYEAEIIPSANTDSPYIATTDYLSAPNQSKVFAASMNGVPSRRTWNVSGSGLLLPPNIGIVAYPNPSPILAHTETFTGQAITVPASGGGSQVPCQVTLSQAPNVGQFITVSWSVTGSIEMYNTNMPIQGLVGSGFWISSASPGAQVVAAFDTANERVGIYLGAGYVGTSPTTTLQISTDATSGIFSQSYALSIIVRYWDFVPPDLDGYQGQNQSGDTGAFHCYMDGLAYAATACVLGITPVPPGAPWANDATVLSSGITMTDAWQIPGSTGNVDAVFTYTGGSPLGYAVAGMSFGNAAGGEFASGGVTYGVVPS